MSRGIVISADCGRLGGRAAPHATGHRFGDFAHTHGTSGMRARKRRSGEPARVTVRWRGCDAGDVALSVRRTSYGVGPGRAFTLAVVDADNGGSNEEGYGS